MLYLNRKNKSIVNKAGVLINAPKKLHCCQTALTLNSPQFNA